jgi:taurine dioxygenase
MYAAFEALSPPMQRLLCGLTAVHDGEVLYRGRYGTDDHGRAYPRAEHPVIRTHPVTGRQALFVNSFFTTRINGLTKAESDALLAFLFRHIETPEFSCRFRWEPNSVAFWDNRAAQHHAIWDYYPHARSGTRVTIKGDQPFYRASNV